MTTIQLTNEQEQRLRRLKGAARTSNDAYDFLTELANQLPDPIRVGDRVAAKHDTMGFSAGYQGVVIATYTDYAWVAWDGRERPGVWLIENLERA